MAGVSLGAVLDQGGAAPAPKVGLAQAPTPQSTAPQKVITLSHNAADQARRIMERDGHDLKVCYLRLGVKGGGCSGMSYLIDVSTKKDSLDVEFEYFGVRVLVDKKSLLYLGGTQLDYGTGLQAGWKFLNPNTRKGCSCGESFSV